MCYMACGPNLFCTAGNAGIPVASSKMIFSVLGLDYGFTSRICRGEHMLEEDA